MRALTEEHTGRTVELRHHDALRTVDYKSSLVGHVRNLAEIDVLDFRREVLVVGIGAVQFESCLEGDAVSESSHQTLFNSVTRRVYVIVEELEYEVVASVGNGEVLGKHFVQSLVSALFGRGVELEEVAERLELHLEEIRVRKRVSYRGKVNAGFIYRN